MLPEGNMSHRDPCLKDRDRHDKLIDGISRGFKKLPLHLRESHWEKGATGCNNSWHKLPACMCMHLAGVLSVVYKVLYLFVFFIYRSSPDATYRCATFFPWNTAHLQGADFVCDEPIALLTHDHLPKLSYLASYIAMKILIGPDADFYLFTGCGNFRSLQVVASVSFCSIRTSDRLSRL
ncbi:hypothetical protein DFH11DRAFT_1212983 [Phellopilus nigrolimitatus]|nr:hypothetical protein DFH11DRAFT_1212983 [Phellopilus nigrolimitatus]